MSDTTRFTAAELENAADCFMPGRRRDMLAYAASLERERLRLLADKLEAMEGKHRAEKKLAEVLAAQPSAPDGYAVLLFDKASAPGGYWFAGIYHDRESAERLANKNGKCEVRPMAFAAPQPEQVKA